MVVLVLVALLRLPAFFVDVFNSDETFLATQAQVIRNGGSLYEDATDRKPPLVPYLYAATFATVGSTALWSVRVVAMLAVALTALLLAAEARRRWGERAAWFAALLFVAASVAFAPQDGQAANFEVFMLPAMTACVPARGAGQTARLGVRRRGRHARQADRRRHAASRCCTSRGRRAAGGASPPRSRRSRSRSRSSRCSSVPATSSSGRSPATARTSGSAARPRTSMGLFAVMTFAFLACNLPIVWTIPTAWRRRVRGQDTDLWLWLLSAAMSVAVGLRFFGHYYLQLLPPLCLISAGALVQRSERVARGTVAFALTAAAGFTIVGFVARPWGDEPKYERVSQYLERHLGKSDRVFVWGHEPEIYWASGALPGTRFLSDGFVNGNWGGRPPGRHARATRRRRARARCSWPTSSCAGRGTSSTRRRPRSAARSTTR